MLAEDSMSRWTKDRWERLDWRKPNRQLALETGKSAAWIAHQRWQLGKSRATLKFPVKPYRLDGRAGSTASCRRAEMRGVRRKWRLVSPEGRVIEGPNLRELVRKHAGLFPEGSANWSIDRTGIAHCEAERKLYHSAGRGVAWRGWTAKRLNDQEDAQIEHVLQIARRVAERRGIALKDIRSRKRTGSVVQARAEAMQEARNQGYEHVVIGRALNRTQGAVSYAINKIDARSDRGSATPTPIGENDVPRC